MFPFKSLFPRMLYPTYEDGDISAPKPVVRNAPGRPLPKATEKDDPGPY